MNLKPLSRRIAEAVAQKAFTPNTPEMIRVMADEIEPVIAAELPPDDAASELLAALEKAEARQGFTNEELIEARAAIARAKGAGHV